ncbi:MAG: hypothetical protein E6175_08500, partial [Anaerococcus sp.]|nr:hypothetical protein [Anaerococcus sp.]
MKLNKRIASGALALALVTPVVANAAEDTTYVTTTLPKAVTDKVVVDGKTYTKAQFQEALKQANKDYNEYLAAKAEADNLEESLKVAKDRYNKAFAAYKELVNAKKEDKEDKETNFDIAKEDLKNKTGEELTEDNFLLKDGKVTIVEDNKAEEPKEKELKATGNLQKGELDQAIDRAKEAYKELVEARENAEKPVKDSEVYREYTTASNEKDRLQQKYDAADKKAKEAKDKSDKSFGALNAIAQAYNVIVEATNNGIAVVDKDQKPADKEISAEQLAKLQKSIDKANETLKAVDLLKQFAPNTAKLNTAKLDALVAEQKATIAKAEAIIKGADKKVALISTAFAAEESKEEVTSEDVDALIKELDDNTDAINKEMENLDKQVKDEDEEKPADKDEDKKDEDKKEDKKDEDKKED